MPIYIAEGVPYRPEVILWLELPSDILLTASILDRKAPVPFAETLRQAMAAPTVGEPRRPHRVRIADEGLAREVRGAFPDLEVVVAPTPELEGAMRHFANFAAQSGEEETSYFEQGRVAPELVAALFRSALVLHTMAPWKAVGDGLALRLDIPALEVEAACVSIIGALGENLGILIFPSLKECEAFRSAAERPRRRPGSIDLGTSVLSLTFERGADLPQRMRREALEHGWPVRSPDAYPRVEHRERDASLRPLTERDVRIASACALSLASLFARSGDVLAAGDFEPICASFYDNADLEVRITVPCAASPLFKINRPERPAPSKPSAGKKKMHMRGRG